ncbi:regulator [Salmonella enterica subsp. salamae]|uniref:Regulator n=2 Tax=Salmonella enterica TaxID=28901 RepID=A0A763MWY2_SALER|nr:regulator [Salmonella enterica subsp. salamae]EEO8344823.1 regulator [Salmonella enterica]ECI3454292.1 regulator [Salmonella enterica subsp. salamae]ECJ2327130.1 regulator [Salmonella enterica subsp. salamae]HAG4415423.1 regulator [Salmonella enterica]
MKESYVKIMRYLLKKRGRDPQPVKTREIADAAELSIYQARQHLEYLSAAGIVCRISSGRGKSSLWHLIS